MTVCLACGDVCKVVQIDVGIGQYEFWGYRSVDVQIVNVSDCCESTFANIPEPSLERTPFDD